MVGKKVQVPVLGGLRKVIQVPTSQNVGTTIQEFGASVVTLAQLKTALGITSTKTTTVGGGSLGSVSLVVGPGLSGGGVLTGAVPLNLTAPIPFLFGEDGGGGDGDGQMGPPGLNGVTGAVGPQGPPIAFTTDEPEETLNAIPGSVGPQGLIGAAGPMGPAIFLAAEDGEEGDIGPPGPAGPAGTGGATGVNVTPDTHPSSPTAWDDEFEANSLNAKWAWLNQSTSIAIFNAGSMIYSGITAGGANAAISAVTQSLSGAGSTWTFACKVAANDLGAGTKEAAGGLLLYNSSNGKSLLFGYGQSGSSLKPLVAVQRFNSNSSLNSTIFSSADLEICGTPVNADLPWCYMRISWNGTTYSFDYSRSGIQYQSLVTETPGAFLGTADTIGLGTDNFNAAFGYFFFDWFRKLA